MSDNGPPFGATEFITFCRNCGIECLKSPPYHPQSNGSAERAVQTVKSSLKKYLVDPKYRHKSWDFKISNFLLKYRTTPTTVTGTAPSSLIFRFKPKTLLDNLNPKSISNAKTEPKRQEIKNNKEDVNDNKSPRNRNIPQYNENEVVLYRNVLNNYHKWIHAKIVKRLSNVRYCIDINGKKRVAHINQLKKFVGRIVKLNSNTLTYCRNNHKRKRSDTACEVELRRSERIKKQREEVCLDSEESL